MMAMGSLTIVHAMTVIYVQTQIDSKRVVGFIRKQFSDRRNRLHVAVCEGVVSDENYAIGDCLS